MTEIKRIQCRLERDGRQAYKRARENNSAYIAIGNSIYRISADGTRKKVKELTTTRVKAKTKRFAL